MLRGFHLKDKFMVGNKISQGQHGVVYECFRKGRKFAVKFSTDLQLLGKEARTLKKLDLTEGQNVAKLVDYDVLVLRNVSKSATEQSRVLLAYCVMPFYELTLMEHYNFPVLKN